MGMFDNIKSDYPLPKDKISQYPDLASFNLQEEIYQTKDLENFMYSYTIKEDGTLWIDSGEQQFITDTINFYTYVNIEEGPNDFMIEFCGKWADGILQSLECFRVDSIPNQFRKDSMKKYRELLKRNDKFFFKFIYLPYAKIVRKVFYRMIRIIDGLQNLLWKMERFLTPL